MKLVKFALISMIAALMLVASGAGGGAIAEDSVRLLVPATVIYPGDVIKDELIIDRAFGPNMPGAAAFAADRASLVGRVARRTLVAGQPIPINALEEQKLVARGNVVKVIVEDGSLSIVTYASSLQSGSPGTMIQLRNLDTGVIIRGIIQSDGSVRIQNG
ncbi:flagellar basal body P-ring formation chaperone FlgA [Bradyrhizobium sp. Leo121]|uniref:flagellar basal body P-ring formation chaperone FlgA n=1 Tax=Bradyrhizobium sp. Leo121 TaxID=1571195 RepID=UPI001FE0C84F|nr:flagellar basal body P-ring formation chaperone FlgA [Bradyrhizobium sp. Leo121]